MDINYIIEDISKALGLIKNGEILLSVIDGNKIFFASKKNKVLLQAPSYTCLISYEEFTSLYHNNKFIIYNYKDAETVDLLKDEQYYSWNPLKK